MQSTFISGLLWCVAEAHAAEGEFRATVEHALMLSCPRSEENRGIYPLIHISYWLKAALGDANFLG